MEMAVKNRQTVKRLKELTLLDRFLFAETMEDKRNLQLILSILYPPCPLIYGGKMCIRDRPCNVIWKL